MTAAATNLSDTARYISQPVSRPRSDAKRSRILDTAMRHFAVSGYHTARVGEIAAKLGIAKGSIFQHFGSKEGLFFEVYKRAVRSIPKYLDAPPEVLASGFFEVVSYCLSRTERMLREDWVPYRIALLGSHGTDLMLKREIHGFLSAEDPYGTVAFVRFGLERGELRKDMDVAMMVSIVAWTMDRFQDALLTAELDQGVFRRQGEMPEKNEPRIRQFLTLLHRALGSVLESPGRERGKLRKAADAGAAKPKLLRRRRVD